jgi:hypothetical protein
VRRAPNKHASRSSDRLANELNRQELNRIASGSFLGLFEPFFPLVFALDLSRLE